MNKAQTRHVEAKARKVEVHLDSMSRRISGIRRVPGEVVLQLFGELEGYWQNSESVLTNMLLGLPDQ